MLGLTTTFIPSGSLRPGSSRRYVAIGRFAGWQFWLVERASSPRRAPSFLLTPIDGIALKQDRTKERNHERTGTNRRGDHHEQAVIAGTEDRTDQDVSAQHDPCRRIPVQAALPKCYPSSARMTASAKHGKEYPKSIRSATRPGLRP